MSDYMVDQSSGPATARYSAAAATFLFRATFIHHEIASLNFRSIELRNSCLRFRIVSHFNKAEAFAALCEFVGYNLGRSNFAKWCKQVGKVLIFQPPT